MEQESAKEHNVLTVYPTPASADVLAVPIIRRPKRLLHDADTALPEGESTRQFHARVMATVRELAEASRH